MLLYKYVPFESGEEILETNTIGFSQPEFFNDPFDLPAYPLGKYVEPIGEVARKAYTNSMLRFMKMNRSWAQTTGILSLTRTPTNSLMWAHYAQSHEGLVLGIDMVRAGLTDPERNLIPAQFGSVVYVSHRSQQPFLSTPETTLVIGDTHYFPQDHYEKLQRLFLNKPLCWSYEEEVRVVKCLGGISEENGTTRSGDFKIVQRKGRPLYALLLPKGCIQEIYFGIRSDHEASDALYHKARTVNPDLSAYECKLDVDSLSVGFSNYATLANAAIK